MSKKLLSEFEADKKMRDSFAYPPEPDVIGGSSNKKMEDKVVGMPDGNSSGMNKPAVYVPSQNRGTGKAAYGLDFESSKNTDDFINANSPFGGFRITSKTGNRDPKVKGASKNHAGIDRAVPAGTAISVPMNTTFYASGYDDARGNWIEVKDANGYILHYQHLQDVGSFKKGQVIPSGTTLARSGSSGVGRAHLHEEYYSPDGKNVTENYWAKYAKSDGKVVPISTGEIGAGTYIKFDENGNPQIPKTAGERQSLLKKAAEERQSALDKRFEDAGLKSDGKFRTKFDMMRELEKKDKRAEFKSGFEDVKKQKNLTLSSIKSGISGAVSGLANFIDMTNDKINDYSPLEKHIAKWAIKNSNPFTKYNLMPIDEELTTNFIKAITASANKLDMSNKEDVEKSIAEIDSEMGRAMATVYSGAVNTVTEQIPNVAIAFLTRGGSAAPAVANGVKGKLINFGANLLKNPGFYYSYMRTAGDEYKEALDFGASKTEARAAGHIIGILNAAVEYSGGMEKALPGMVGRKGFLKKLTEAWGKSAFEEGIEEGVQDNITSIVHKLIYKKDSPWVSITDTDAAINPLRTGQSMLMGYLIGGILGTGGAAVSSVGVAFKNAVAPEKQTIKEKFASLEERLKNGEFEGKSHEEIMEDSEAQEFVGLIRKNRVEDADESGKFSVGNNYDYTKSFAQQIDDWKKGLLPGNDSLIVSGTPKVFRDIGFNPLPVTINQTHVDYAINGTKDTDHTLGESLLSQLPQALETPVAVISSQTQQGRVVAILKMQHNNKNVVVPVEIDGYARQNNIRIDSNAIASVFGKGNAATKLIVDALNAEANGNINVFYWDKKEASSLLQRAGLQLPGGLPQDGFVHSITEKGSPVKKKIDNVTLTQQFKRWFGNSKVVNTDGTPKVVYHGTNKNFTIFKSHDDTYWFSESYDYAEAMAEERGGKNIMQAYISIKKPYYAKLPEGEFSDPTFEKSIIAAAKAGNYDGVIIECDTDNELVYDKFYVAFDPTQIKSATDNIGTFNKDEPDIRYSTSNSRGKRYHPLNRIQRRFFSSFGVDVVVLPDLPEGANAKILTKSGKLLVSPYAKVTGWELARHEFTHYIKTFYPKAYKGYVEAVKLELGDKWQSEYDRVYKKYEAFALRYPDEDISLDEDVITEEVVAEYAEGFKNSGFMKRTAERDLSVAAYIRNALRNLLQRIKAIFTPAELRANRESIEYIMTAKDMWEKAVIKAAKSPRTVAKIVLKNVMESGIINPTEAGAFSVKWYPDISLRDLNTLRQKIKSDIKRSTNSITNTSNWILTDINGTEVFAIYSTEDYAEPTILYESKGKQAVFEREILLDLLEGLKSGKSVDRKSDDINTVLRSGWVRKGSSTFDHTGSVGGGRNDRNAGVLQRSSKRHSNAAFKSVIRNLIKIQYGGISTDEDGKFSYTPPMDADTGGESNAFGYDNHI